MMIEFPIMKKNKFRKMDHEWIRTDEINQKKLQKSMNCVSGQKGQFLCINRNCQVKNCFVCSDPEDSCKQSHESCSLINLPYLLKKSQIDNNPKNKTNRLDKLIPISDKAKSIANTINNALASFNIVREINSFLEEGKPLNPEEKDKIAKFMGDRKIDQAQDGIFSKIEKELEEFQTIISEFQLAMKEIRNKEIEELKKKLDKEEKQRKSQLPLRSRVDEFEGPKSKNKIIKFDHLKEGDEELLPMKSNIFEVIIPSPVKSRIPDQLLSARKFKMREKDFGTEKAEKRGSEKKETNEKAKNSATRPRPNEFEEKISNILKNHLPKAPLFSKITNDIKTINTFFQDKFEQARLLYRASENDYLVSNFHDKCDGHKYTLTLVLTEFDKIIGGYTPLPWKSGGGEWYSDPEKKSFIFNLTSGERYPLLNSEKAIWCSRTYGPSFGHPDLEIADKSFYNSNSCANFPNCYNNGNYKNTPDSTQLFCGTKNGHFRIKEWEVYQLIFS